MSDRGLLLWPADVELVREELDRLEAPERLYSIRLWRILLATLEGHEVSWRACLADYLFWLSTVPASRRHKDPWRGLRNWVKKEVRRSERPWGLWWDQSVKPDREPSLREIQSVVGHANHLLEKRWDALPKIRRTRAKMAQLTKLSILEIEDALGRDYVEICRRLPDEEV